VWLIESVSFPLSSFHPSFEDGLLITFLIQGLCCVFALVEAIWKGDSWWDLIPAGGSLDALLGLIGRVMVLRAIAKVAQHYGASRTAESVGRGHTNEPRGEV